MPWHPLPYAMCATACSSFLLSSQFVHNRPSSPLLSHHFRLWFAKSFQIDGYMPCYILYECNDAAFILYDLPMGKSQWNRSFYRRFAPHVHFCCKHRNTLYSNHCIEIVNYTCSFCGYTQTPRASLFRFRSVPFWLHWKNAYRTENAIERMQSFNEFMSMA